MKAKLRIGKSHRPHIAIYGDEIVHYWTNEQGERFVDRIENPVKDVWALYVQRGKDLYWNLRSVGTNLKTFAGQTRECNVTDTSIWLHEDRTCPRCNGHKCNWRKARANEHAPNGVVWTNEPCPRCAGKGYWTLSDEARYNTWQEARACQEFGCTFIHPANRPKASNPEWEAKKARVAKAKAYKNAQATRRAEMQKIKAIVA